MVDTPDLKSCDRKVVRVRIPLPALHFSDQLQERIYRSLLTERIRPKLLYYLPKEGKILSYQADLAQW